jgi:hypothetical protein
MTAESPFARLHGLLLALTPQEQTRSDSEQRETDLRRVKNVFDLPPRLLMGSWGAQTRSSLQSRRFSRDGWRHRVRDG